MPGTGPYFASAPPPEAQRFVSCFQQSISIDPKIKTHSDHNLKSGSSPSKASCSVGLRRQQPKIKQAATSVFVVQPKFKQAASSVFVVQPEVKQAAPSSSSRQPKFKQASSVFDAAQVSIKPGSISPNRAVLEEPVVPPSAVGSSKPPKSFATSRGYQPHPIKQAARGAAQDKASCSGSGPR